MKHSEDLKILKIFHRFGINNYSCLFVSITKPCCHEIRRNAYLRTLWKFISHRNSLKLELHSFLWTRGKTFREFLVEPNLILVYCCNNTLCNKFLLTACFFLNKSKCSNVLFRHKKNLWWMKTVASLRLQRPRPTLHNLLQLWGHSDLLQSSDL